MNQKLFLIGLFTLFFVLQFNQIRATSLLPNGSFETGDFTDWNVSTGYSNYVNYPARHIFCGTGGDCSILRNTVFIIKGDMNICFIGNVNVNTGPNNEVIEILNGNATTLGSRLFSLNWDTSNTPFTGIKYGCFKTSSNYSDINGEFPNLIILNGLINQTQNQILSGTFPGSDGSKLYNIVYNNGGDVNVLMDKFIFQQFFRLSFSNDKNPSPVEKSTSFNLGTKILDENGVLVTDANVELRFNNGSWQQMNYLNSTGFYEVTILGSQISSVGDYNYGMRVNKINYLENTSLDKMVKVKDFEHRYLKITPIENIKSVFFNSVEINPLNENNQIIFRIDSNSLDFENPQFKILNSLIDKKQYFIYTASSLQFVQGIWVFNDSLTYSSSFNSQPIQKIWNSNIDKYEHSFFDSILPIETKFYKLTYKSPIYSWNHQDNDWFKQATPGIFFDDTFFYDSFTLSSHLNFYNYPQKELSQLISNQNKNYEFQFTGFTNDLNANVSIFLLQPDNSTETLIKTVNVTQTKTRFSVSFNPSSFNQKILIKSNQSYPVTVYLVDYAIVDRGFFASPLKLVQSDGSELPIIIQQPNFFQYVTETGDFLARTLVYDREGDLNQLKVQLFFDNNSASNAATLSFQPLSFTGFQSLEKSFSDVIDLPDSATNVLVKFTLTDKNGTDVAEQSKTIRFLQFPYFPTDLVFSVFDNSQLIGDSPNGTVSLITKQPKNILGVEFYIYNDTNSPATPNFYTAVFKPEQFDCIGGNDCSFNYKIPNFAFSKDSNKWFITAQVLLRTRNRTIPSLTGDAVAYVFTITKQINFLALTKAKIVQTFERNNRKYKNTEEIALTLELENVLHDDIRKDLRVWIGEFDCGSNATGACVGDRASYFYNPLSSIYDPLTGTNYFFFKNIFLRTPDSSLLGDGNYHRIVAFVSDATGRYNNASSLNILLADKADAQIVTTVTNSSNEKRILIDNSISLTAPNYEVLACLRTDNNLTFSEPRKAEINCLVWYSIKNIFPDKFTFRISNNNSDTTETVDSYKQFIDFEVPYNLIAINDVSLMRQALAAHYHTDCGLDIACLSGQLFNYFASSTLNGIGSFSKQFTEGDFNSVLIKNVNFDVNFARFADPTFAQGIFLVNFTNLNFLNKQDFTVLNPSLENINPKFFVRFASQNKIGLPKTKTNVELIGSGLQSFLKFQDSHFLVIDEKPKANFVNNSSSDVNRIPQTTLPTILLVNFSSVLLYSNGLASFYRYVPLTFQTIISQQFSFIGETIAGIGELFSNPLNFVIDHIFEIVLVLGLIFAIGMIWRQFRPGG